jgi:hypothetical protein
MRPKEMRQAENMADMVNVCPKYGLKGSFRHKKAG